MIEYYERTIDIVDAMEESRLKLNLMAENNLSKEGYKELESGIDLGKRSIQKLKRIGRGELYGSFPKNKLVILGALNLYLDFINLFLFLLRFLGNRK